MGAARPAGEGVYRIVNHNGHTHLVYALDLPAEPGSVKHGLNTDVDPPEFLNFEGSEFVLIASSEDFKEDLGIEVKTEDETICSADVFEELKIDRSKRPKKPLFTGEWQ